MTYFDKDDILTMECRIDNPFEPFMTDVWDWISDGCFGGNEEEYYDLDALFQFLTTGFQRDTLPEKYLEWSNGDIQAEYARRFPVLFGKALQKIGRELETDEMRMEITFPMPPKFAIGDKVQFTQEAIEMMQRHFGLDEVWAKAKQSGAYIVQGIQKLPEFHYLTITIKHEDEEEPEEVAEQYLERITT